MHQDQAVDIPAGTAQPAGPGKQTLTPYQKRAFAITCFVAAALSLDYFGFTIALPVIGTELGANTAEVGWVMNASQLGFAATIIGLGRLADLVGRVRMMIAGCILFGVSAIVAATADDLIMLIVGRTINGVCSAMIGVSGLAILTTIFDRRMQRRAIGMLSASGLAAGIVGPFLSGFLTQYLSWRWFFLIDGVMAAIGLVLLAVFLKEPKAGHSGERLDIFGFVTMAAGVVVLILSLDRADQLGWRAPSVIAGLVVGAALLLVFYVIERLVRSPLVDFSLFRHRDFLGGCVVMFLAAVPSGALMLFLTLYLQHVLGLSPVLTAVVFLASMVPGAAFAMVSGQVTDRLGVRATLIVSRATVVLAFVCFGFSRPHAGVELLLLGLFLFGVGQAIGGTAPSAAAVADVPSNRSAQAAGIFKSIRAIGGTLGIAVAGVLFRTSEHFRLDGLYRLAGDRLTAEEQSDIHDLLSGSDAAREHLAAIAPDLAARVDVVVNDAFAYAFRDVMFFFIAVSAAAFIAVFIVRPDDEVS